MNIEKVLEENERRVSNSKLLALFSKIDEC